MHQKFLQEEWQQHGSATPVVGCNTSPLVLLWKVFYQVHRKIASGFSNHSNIHLLFWFVSELRQGMKVWKRGYWQTGDHVVYQFQIVRSHSK